MMKMNFSWRAMLAVAAMTLVASGVEAKLRLPHILSDNLILQRNAEARLWGWANKGQTVAVKTSWDGKTHKAEADSEGKWLVRVATPEASFTPHEITISQGKESVVLHNVLVGEVWVCAGQSNMEMPLRGFGCCPVEGVTEAVADAADDRGIRFVKIPAEMRMTPQEDADCHWVETGVNTVLDCSATGYFFGRTLSRVLKMPVGLILANKGGTRVESWLTRENLEKYTEEDLDSMAQVKKFSWDYHRALMWGNGTFNPILKYTVGGIVFYQGCSNVGNPGNMYSELLKVLVEQWREQFDCGELPFYFVEIAPFHYDNAEADWGARLREQQYRASQIIPNSGLVCTNDLVYPYEKEQIHPCKKRQVGQRLAYLALGKHFGYDNIMCESPHYAGMEISGDSIWIKWDNTYGGTNRQFDYEGFEIAGEDRVFHPAKVTYQWDRGFCCTSEEVKNPVAVRYCFKNFQLGNAANNANLPLFPFRTDDWE